jgi:hypothetical protein
MYWIVGFIFLCALGAVWSMLSDHESQRDRKLRRIRKRLEEKEREQRESAGASPITAESETRPNDS